ncbi:hypothetical protein BDD12DRAFT_729469 [Trichophaea hybrida]|nr:hypothetical protein BDD12DRAFT_729469 [Trichophaea hybrida]
MVPGERDEAEDEDEDDDDYDSDSDYDYSSNEEEEDDDEVVAAAAGVGVAGVGVEVYRARSGSIAIIAAGRSRQEEYTSAQDTVFWGWVVLLSTWVVFVVGIGSVMGVWEWAWGGEPKTWPRSVGGEKDYPGEFPIPGYYPAMCILTCIMAWVWVVVAWVGMKYFKHAKIQT